MTLVKLMLVVLSLPALAGPRSPSGEASARFSPVDRLAGRCWDGVFADGKTHDHHCWEWTLRKSYVRAKHEVRGAGKPYGGETFYGWDSGARVLRFWYFNTLGGRSEGTVEQADPDGAGRERWLVLEHYAGSNPGSKSDGKLELRTFLVIGDEFYEVVTEKKESDGWKPMMSIHYQPEQPSGASEAPAP